MHGAINTANRYEHCLNCGRDAAFDTLLGACTVTSCARYFGKMGPYVERWENVLPTPAGPSHWVPGTRVSDGRGSARPPSTRELVEAEQAVLRVVRGTPHSEREVFWSIGLMEAADRLDALNA